MGPRWVSREGRFGALPPCRHPRALGTALFMIDYELPRPDWRRRTASTRVRIGAIPVMRCGGLRVAVRHSAAAAGPPDGGAHRAVPVSGDFFRSSSTPFLDAALLVIGAIQSIRRSGAWAS